MAETELGLSRKKIDVAELLEHKKNHTIVEDERRRRPLWFDGRFLDAKALTAEQHYFLSRQADIARVVGVGIVKGLMVSRVENTARTIKITAGHGITASGETVMLPDDFNSLDLSNVALQQQLDLQFGLAELPHQPLRNRSGLFILALRPVVYTADPLSSYPTSVTGERSAEDRNIIEATAITMLPYPDQGARTELTRRRAHVAREIFIDGSQKGQPTGVLPLAMLALNEGVIEWVDPYLVRREVGSAEQDIFGLGLAPRVLREAFLRQYFHHLDDMAGTLEKEQSFVAADNFLALPPAGPLPLSAINTDDFTQRFFPMEMDVQLTVIAEDELSSMLEESYSLPAIDLTKSGEDYESTSIQIMVPLARHRIRKVSLSLQSLIKRLSAVAPGIVAKRTPLLTIMNLLKYKELQTDEEITTALDVWREVLQSTDTLWYARRRNVSYKADVVSLPIPVTRDEEEVETEVEDRFTTINIKPYFDRINQGTFAARAEVMTLLGAKKFKIGPKLMTRAAALEIQPIDTNARINRIKVLSVSERFSTPKFGQGLQRLKVLKPDIDDVEDVAKVIAGSMKVPELDKVSSHLTNEKLSTFASKLLIAADPSKPEPEKEVAKVIDEALKQIKAPVKLPGRLSRR